MLYKILFFIVIFVSIIVNIYLVSLLINIGSATNDANSEKLRQIERNQVALLIMQHDWIGQDISKLNKLINKLDKKIIIKYNNSSIEIHDMVFTLSNNKIINVIYLD
jgi:hypothetical protein